jgi:hypothetical protein
MASKPAPQDSPQQPGDGITPDFLAGGKGAGVAAGQQTGNAKAAPGPADGLVRLFPVPPLESLTLPPFEGDRAPVVIGPEGADVDPETAQRAHAEAMRAGHKLREG